jgi:hypothetical protein
VTTTYITLIEHGANIGVGSLVDDGLAVTDPRTLPFSDLLYDEVPTLGDFVDGTASAKLVTVEPLTTPVEGSTDTCSWFEAPSWRVTGEAAIAAVIGPQGSEVIAAMEVLNKGGLTGVYEPDGAAPADQYYTLIEATYDAMRDAQDHAVDALEKAGADRTWWETYAFACNFGQEVVAIAARDLIGTVPGWTAEAHDLLTAPYRAAFGDDAPGAKKLAA